MDAALLDTDILSELLKQRNQGVIAKATSYLLAHGAFAFSTFTRFEIERGYREKNVSRLLARFAVFCQHSLIFPVSDDVFDRAAEIWV